MIKIVIDPGHGGTDRTNTGPTGYVEADGNLKTAIFLRDILLDKYKNIEVKLTRDTDVTLSLSDRGKMGAGADLFHSIHSNAGAPYILGTEVFYSVDLPEDKEFAATMSRRIAYAFDTSDRGAKSKESAKYPGEDYYTVIDVAQDSGAKHVLLSESLFHSNPIEEAILKDDKNLRKIAEIMAETYEQFLGLEKKEIAANAEYVKIGTVSFPEQVSSWAKTSWVKASRKIGKDGRPINDGLGPKMMVTEEQLMVFFDKLGLLD